MSISGFSINKPVTTLVFLASIIVMGVISTTRMKLAYFPDVEFPGIFIQVPYPNSSPQQIEKNIIKPIEEALSTLSGIKKMESRATADEGSIQLQFDWGVKLDMVRTEVAEKIEMIRKAACLRLFFLIFSNDHGARASRRWAAMSPSTRYSILRKTISINNV